MKIILIAAIDEEGGIGKNGRIPWYCPEDLAHFNRTTMGNSLICGRVTADMLPDLPGRVIYQVSRPELILDDLLDQCEINGLKQVFVIGGQEVFQQTINLCDEIILTEIPRKHGCDRFFPSFDPSEFSQKVAVNACGMECNKWIR